MKALVLISLVAALTTSELHSHSHVVTNGDWSYFVTEGEGATITHYHGPGGSVVIPSIIGDDSVVAIGTTSPAFWGTPFANRSDIDNITVPDSVTQLGTMAFYKCFGLQQIFLGAGVRVVRPNAFDGCTNLSTIHVAESNEFYTSYQGALVNKSVTVLIHVPQAFNGTFLIPSSILSVNEFAFNGSPNITGIDVSTDHPSFTSNDGVLFNQDLSRLVVAPPGKTGSYVVPNSVRHISSSAFAYSKLSSVILPEGLLDIPGRCFYRSYFLSNVGLPSSLRSIGWAAFRECPILESVSLPGNLLSISHEAFMRCDALEFIAIPKSVTSIGSGAFEGCINLRSVTVGESVQSIGGMAFSHCPNLGTILFLGNAPVTSGEPFAWLPDNKPLLFRLAHTSGWGDFWQPGDSRWKRPVLTINERLYTEAEYSANRINGHTDVTGNPSAFNLFTQEQCSASHDNGVSTGMGLILSNPANYNLYTSDSIMDLRMGGLMLQKQGSNAVVTFQPQTTTDLTQPFTNNGTPITNTIPMPGNKSFIRIQANPTPVPPQ